jgi:hypothetical protein
MMRHTRQAQGAAWLRALAGLARSKWCGLEPVVALASYIYGEKASGKSIKGRPELEKAIDVQRPGTARMA